MSSTDSVSITAGVAVPVTPGPTPAPSVAATVPPSPTLAPLAPPLGEALASPPELEWEFDAETGVLSGALEFGVVTMKNFWGETKTRGFNGMVSISCLLGASSEIGVSCIWGAWYLKAVGIVRGMLSALGRWKESINMKLDVMYMYLVR